MNRCRLCPGTYKCLPPDGRDGDLLFIGEAPGKQEEEKGCVFKGRTGEEVNGGYLPLAGLRRGDVQMVNAISCLPDTNGHKLDSSKRPHLALLEECSRHRLYPLIERQRPPKLLIPLGSFACRAVCPDVDLDRQHGFPVQTKWGIPAFPMYHPAQGMYEPKKMLMLRSDWQRLGLYLRKQLVLPRDEYPNPDYREITTIRELDDYFDPDLLTAADTEFTRRQDPYCLTLAQYEGTGRLIRASRTDLLESFERRVRHGKGVFLFHNWLADAPITAAMGLASLHPRVIDTMVEVFHLGNLPQGLKNLAWRELGMGMQDFSDLVRPYSSALVLDYYDRARDFPWPKPEPDLVQDDAGKWKVSRPQGMNTKLKRFFTDFWKDPEGKDVFKAWDNWKAEQAMIEAELGEWPGFCITHVPFEELLPYACRDVDSLYRLWPILERMRRNVRRREQHDWRAT